MRPAELANVLQDLRRLDQLRREVPAAVQQRTENEAAFQQAYDNLENITTGTRNPVKMASRLIRGLYAEHRAEKQSDLLEARYGKQGVRPAILSNLEDKRYRVGLDQVALTDLAAIAGLPVMKDLLYLIDTTPNQSGAAIEHNVTQQFQGIQEAPTGAIRQQEDNRKAANTPERLAAD